jgi:hypothetical protein
MTWEVVIACLSATFASSVVFAEPDVQCEFLGQRFAVAAKVAYSERKLRARVMEGFDQADGRADASLVFVDVVQLLSPIKALEVSRRQSFMHNDEAVALFNPEIDHWLKRLGVDAWKSRLKEKASRPVGVAFFLPLFLHSEGLGGPVPYFCTRIPVVWSESSVDVEFAKKFQEACVEVLGFRTSRGEPQ